MTRSTGAVLPATSTGNKNRGCSFPLRQKVADSRWRIGWRRSRGEVRANQKRGVIGITFVGLVKRVSSARVRALELIKFLLPARSPKIWNFGWRARGKGGELLPQAEKRVCPKLKESPEISGRPRAVERPDSDFPRGRRGGEGARRGQRRAKTSWPRTLWNLFETSGSHSARGAVRVRISKSRRR